MYKSEMKWKISSRSAICNWAFSSKGGHTHIRIYEYSLCLCLLSFFIFFFFRLEHRSNKREKCKRRAHVIWVPCVYVKICVHVCMVCGTHYVLYVFYVIWHARVVYRVSKYIYQGVLHVCAFYLSSNLCLKHFLTS